MYFLYFPATWWVEDIYSKLPSLHLYYLRNKPRMTSSLNYFDLYGANSSHHSPYWFLSQLIDSHSKTGCRLRLGPGVEIEFSTTFLELNTLGYGQITKHQHFFHPRSRPDLVILSHGGGIQEVSTCHSHRYKKKKKSLARTWAMTLFPNSLIKWNIPPTSTGIRHWKMERREKIFSTVYSRY